ncbi:NAD(P)-dependent oxidoreductase [Marinobacterium sp. LSUCC0821]|uniref:NAD(P)-dependent oxidoreductase n=1 Tax=Marinobacterium sp. LSUCC0821 TaxID=2668067 RepID=UPI001452220F|nr:NAD(P)-dependent oxidoreductase [Marinobacterium sp. LSUCC0821]QJD70776.1 NAD(P)-dependent oxidoreductase [Marinobacterium sp. LSUCC0821]
MKTVSMLGIGLMGLPMAARLLDAGFTVRVWNRTAEKCVPLVDKGAYACSDLNEAARSDILITMLANGQVVKEVVERLVAENQLTEGKIVIDMSSTSLDEVKEISELVLSAGASFIDAPVSGGVKGAEEGTLAIMAGSHTANHFNAVEDVLRAMGRPVRVGDVGAGQVSKLANQAIVGGTIGIVSEAILLLERAGVNSDAFRDALRGGFADSSILQLHSKRMSERSFVPGGKVTTQLKDERNILDAAKSFGITLPITQSIYNRYELLANDLDKGALDHSALFLELLAQNGLD